MSQSIELVQHEHDRTRPKLSAWEEHEERVNGIIDRAGRRMHAFSLWIAIFAGGLFAVGVYAILFLR